ncbi:hypothetical protein [Paucibacter sp. M5-1]|uniref:hypothetical protein n=1 Tax=Paucibacter sp. M5-1 TaxID=3015998 RepID=UPI003F7D7EE7
MCDHLNPRSARLVCLARVLPRPRRRIVHRGPLRSIAARYCGFRRCVEWGSATC